MSNNALTAETLDIHEAQVWVRGMTNWQRNQWARYGHYSLRRDRLMYYLALQQDRSLLPAQAVFEAVKARLVRELDPAGLFRIRPKALPHIFRAYGLEIAVARKIKPKREWADPKTPEYISDARHNLLLTWLRRIIRTKRRRAIAKDTKRRQWAKRGFNAWLCLDFDAAARWLNPFQQSRWALKANADEAIHAAANLKERI